MSRSYTVQNLIDAVRTRLADTDSESYDDATMITFINNGVHELALATGCYREGTTYTTTSNEDGSIALDVDISATNGDFITIVAIDFNYTPLDQATIVQARGWDLASGTPEGWALFGDVIKFDKAPGADNSINIWYTYLPEDIDEVSDNIAPSAFNPANGYAALVAYVEYRCRARSHEGGLADRARSEWTDLRDSIAQISLMQTVGVG